MPSTLQMDDWQKELMRRGNEARRLIRQGNLEGWVALDLVTAPASVLLERAEDLGMELEPE